MSKVPRRFIFTINNYEEYPPRLPTGCEYLVCQKEVAPTTGTPHIQGYCELQNNMNLSTLKKLSPDWNKAYIAPARGTAEENTTYCTKEGGTDSFQHGEPKPGQGSRSDLRELCRYVQEGTHDLRDVVDKYPVAFLLHGRHLQALVQMYYKPPRPSSIDESPTWKPWQAEVLAILDQPVHPRHVHFIVDRPGNQGKTYLCRWLAHYRNAYLTGPGRLDYIYVNYANQSIVLFDCPKKPDGTLPLVPYAAIEQFKNGVIPATLYGKPGYMCDPAHVLVFVNFEIDMMALSLDRYVFKYI